MPGAAGNGSVGPRPEGTRPRARSGPGTGCRRPADTIRQRGGLDGAVPWPMAVRRFVWRACYGALAKRVSTPDWAFMNYGYAPAGLDIGAPPLSSSDEPDRLCIQLYLHAIGGFDLRDRDVLEVGSGRGGGASFISRYLQPRSMTGMDFSPDSTEAQSIRLIREFI